MNLLQDTISATVPQDATSRAQAHRRLEALTMPYWALGRLLDLAEDLAGITRSMRPPVARKAIFVMAGDHGVVAEGVSKYPQEVTPQMVATIVAGGAGINALARQVGATVTVVDMGVAGDLSGLAAAGKILSRRIGPGTRNMAEGPALQCRPCAQSARTAPARQPTAAMQIKPFDFADAVARAGLRTDGQPIRPSTQTVEAGNFQTAMVNALKSVSASHEEATSMQQELQLDNPSVSLEQTMIAMNKSQIGFQAAITVRNRLVQAYTDIMNMQV